MGQQTLSASTPELDEVRDYLKQVPEKFFEATKKEVAASLFRADEAIKLHTTLEVRSGNLMKSITTYAEGNSIASLRAGIYTDCVYARIHEYGGTVKAKNAYKGLPGGPYLNIPTSANKTPAGVTRLGAREVFNQGGSIVKLGPMRYGVELDGELMFVLKKYVTLKPQLNMMTSIDNEIPTLMSNLNSILSGAL